MTTFSGSKKSLKQNFKNKKLTFFSCWEPSTFKVTYNPKIDHFSIFISNLGYFKQVFKIFRPNSYWNTQKSKVEKIFPDFSLVWEFYESVHINTRFTTVFYAFYIKLLLNRYNLDKIFQKGLNFVIILSIFHLFYMNYRCDEKILNDVNNTFTRYKNKYFWNKIHMSTGIWLFFKFFCNNSLSLTILNLKNSFFLQNRVLKLETIFKFLLYWILLYVSMLSANYLMTLKVL